MRQATLSVSRTNTLSITFKTGHQISSVPVEPVGNRAALLVALDVCHHHMPQYLRVLLGDVRRPLLLCDFFFFF